MKEIDIVLIDIVSQACIHLSEDDIDVIHSAIDFAEKNYPQNGSTEFSEKLAILNRRFWTFQKRLINGGSQ